LGNAEGTLLKREIVGPTCADASEALAIMVAVAIDPGASEGASETPVEPPRAEPPAVEPPRPEAPRSERAASPRPSFAATPPSVGASVSFDLRLETTTAVIDGPLPGFGASMTVELWFPTGPRWMRAWRPSFGLGLRQSLPVQRDLRRGTGELLWTAGDVRLCPHEVELARIVEAALCAEANLGAFRASVEGVPEARRASTAWVDMGGSVWAIVRFSKRFFLSSTVLVAAPLWRHEFVLESGAPVAHSPPLGVLVGLGVGTRM